MKYKYNKYFLKKKKYVCCVAGYFDPSDTSLDKKIIRLTAVITDVIKDIFVERFEANGTDDSDTALDNIIKLANKYNATIYFLTEPDPLEKCPCNNCDGYLDRCIYRCDLKNISNYFSKGN